MKGIRGLRVMGAEVEIAWKGRDRISLASLFDYLNRGRIIIAFDEAQKFRGPRSREILEAIAHAYDYDKNITFIMTGSEVGLLYEFLGIENQSSPLHGRFIYTIELERFTREQSIDFLEKGFREIDIKIDDEVINEVVDFFDGIPGWLTFFGNYYVTKGEDASIKNAEKIAIDIAAEELRKIGDIRGERYLHIMKLIAKNERSWSRLKKRLEEMEGKTISNSVLSNILNSLENLSIIRDYQFLDKIYEEAAKIL